MKVTTNSQLLTSLASLVDPNQRGQQQALQQQQELRQQEKKAAEQTTKVSRQDNINANRDALRKLQDRLKADNLEKLKADFSSEGQGNQSGRGGNVNLNLRENLGSPSRPQDTRPGQIIDIRV
ncbi:MAG: hypothetical protein GXP00_02260 [Alphaproteobacteria bacterium]|nr:hypothetical protein [Alphaproteobacteria bacterium]